MPELRLADSDGGVAVCSICGKTAVGPCARCHAPTCGDCCVLTEGGTKLYAICLRCEKSGGRSLAHAWRQVIGWFLAPVVALALVLALLSFLFWKP